MRAEASSPLNGFVRWSLPSEPKFVQASPDFVQIPHRDAAFGAKAGQLRSIWGKREPQHRDQPRGPQDSEGLEGFQIDQMHRKSIDHNREHAAVGGDGRRAEDRAFLGEIRF